MYNSVAPIQKLFWNFQPVQSGKEKKKHPDYKGRSKLPLLANDIILYIENPKESTTTKKKLLEPVSKFSKDLGYKSNIQKVTANLHT